LRFLHLQSLKLAGAASATFLFFTISVSASVALPKQFLVYFGTYTATNSKGIYVSRFDAASGELTAPALAAESVNPTFLAITPDHRFLFAANETKSFAGKPGGSVTAFKLDARTGKLKFLNQQSSGGTDPCHLAVDDNGKHVVVANYSSGSVAVLPVKHNGFIGAPASVIQHHGSSVNPQRQAGPHAHCVAMDATSHRVFVCDLGLDKVMIYRLDESTGQLVTNENPPAEFKPGSGPRHMVFHPDGKHAYVINELSSTLTAFDYDSKLGALKETQTISTLPENFRGINTDAEVVIHPSGKFIYATNRGDDSITVFAMDAQTGRLDFVERQPSLGKTPRCFAIDPTGQYLIAANQNSDNIVIFRINDQTGRLTPTGQEFQVGKPVCVVFAPAEPASL
jgi:6-phosphogluconolactonase